MPAVRAASALAPAPVLTTLARPASRLLAGTAARVAHKLLASLARLDPASDPTLDEERLGAARSAGRSQRLWRDLHDDLGPFLASATMRVDAIRTVLARDPAQAEQLICDVHEDLRKAVAELRRLTSRAELPSHEPLDLPTALRLQADSFERACGGRLAIRIICGSGCLTPLPGGVECELYRIASEALTNVVRHSSARRCTVSLRVDDSACLEVLDDGVGLPAHCREGTGLRSMRERAQRLGGRCEVMSGRSGGTLVRASVPLAGRS